MPRNYRPRPYQQRACQHCSMHFETNHSRTKYCGDSCRVKAFYARKATNKPLTPQTTGNLSFSAQDVGVVAAGAAIGAAIGAGRVAVVKYLANDRPAQQHVIDLLNSIKQGQAKVNLTPLTSALEYLVCYVEAQVDAEFTLGPRMLAIQQKRSLASTQAKQRKVQIGQAESNKLLGR